MKKQTKQILATVMACLMAFAVILVAPINNPINEPNQTSTVYDFVIDAFCIPHGFVIGYDTVSFSSSSLDKNGELLITPSSKMTEDELNMDVLSEKMLRPNSYNNYGTPCDNPFETEEWAIVKHFFESEALDRHRPIRVRLYDYPSMVEDGLGNTNITASQYLVDEIIVYPNPDAYELHAKAVEKYYQSEDNPVQPTPVQTPVTKPTNNATMSPKPVLDVNNQLLTVEHKDMTVTINGIPVELEAVVLTDANGGATTYFKLRDVGQSVGFDVGWAPDTGITVDTDNH